MNATIGKMTKRVNSTKQTFSGTAHNVVLKDPVSVKNPKLLIQGTPAMGSNYMSWNGAYYWVDDIISETNGLSWVVAHIDPLATYKASILNSSGMVRFGPVSHKNVTLDDPRMSPDIQWPEARKSAIIPGVDIFSKGGCVVLTAVAATDFAHNGVVQYILSYTEVMQYLAAFGSTIKTDMNGSADVKEAIINLVIGATGGGNWSDNIKSMVWVPFDPNDVISACGGSVISEMGIGGYRVSGPATGLASAPIAVYQTSGSIQVPWESDADTWKFLRLPKYTSMTLCHPGGSVDIDTSCLVDQSTINYTVAINMLNGDYYVKIKEKSSDDAEPLAYAQGNVSIDVTGMIASGGTVGGNAIKAETQIFKNVVIPAFTPASPAMTTTTSTRTVKDESGNVKATINDTVETTHQTGSTGIEKNFMVTGNPPSSCNATLGGTVLNLYQTATFSSQFYIQMNCKKPRTMFAVSDYEAYCDEYGYTINKYLSLSDLTGYVECADISVNPAGSNAPNEHELAALNSALCSGIFIE